MLLNNSHVRGIFKYSDDVYFEKDDFVVDGNCIYVCISGEPIIRKQPSLDTEHLYYSEYPGDKIISASEYYDYVRSTERDQNIEDKYVSAHSLCEILENMYFGFGDNGILYDHILYNPNTGIEYSVRGAKEILDYSTPNVLDQVLRKNDLNNGLLKVSRNLPEIRDLVTDGSSSDSDVVILKQYTYLDSNDLIPYRVQELMDPEKNRLYFRFAKGEGLDDGGHDFTDAIVSKWKNLYSSNEDAIEKLNALEDYYNQRVQEEEAKVARISGKYCYREVEATEFNHLGENVVYLRPGETRDIKSRESFDTSPCLLNILIKVQIDSNVFRNYSIVIDAKDACDSNIRTETYQVSDDISLTSSFDTTESVQKLKLSVSSGVIKNIYYRDYTLGHIHDWVLQETLYPATCTQFGEGIYVCSECSEEKTDSIPPLGHTLTHKDAKRPTCVESGWWEYWLCSRCGIYFKDANTTLQYSGWDTGNDQVYREPLGTDGHRWGGWRTVREATCTTTGKRVRSCTICGQQQIEVTPALGHDVSFVGQSNESCGNYGINQHYHCSRCDKDFSDEHATHEMTSNELLRYPTGAHNLSTYESSDRTTAPIVVRESTYSDYPAVNAPKPEHGIGLEICADCGNEIQISLPFKKHEFSSSQDIQPGQAFVVDGRHYPSYTQGFCPVCSEFRRNYDWDENVSIDRQLENHTVVGRDPSSSSTDPNTYTPATCDEYGYWTGTCVLCGATDVRQYNWNDPPTGHQINRDRIAGWIPNTCTTDAEFRGDCIRCGATNITEVDSAHKEIGHVDNNHDDICDVCRAEL